MKYTYQNKQNLTNKRQKFFCFWAQVCYGSQHKQSFWCSNRTSKHTNNKFGFGQCFRAYLFDMLLPQNGSSDIITITTTTIANNNKHLKNFQTQLFFLGKKEEKNRIQTKQTSRKKFTMKTKITDNGDIKNVDFVVVDDDDVIFWLNFFFLRGGLVFPLTTTTTTTTIKWIHQDIEPINSYTASIRTGIYILLWY